MSYFMVEKYLMFAGNASQKTGGGHSRSPARYQPVRLFASRLIRFRLQGGITNNQRSLHD
jgi:hypothetical protein